MSHVMKILPIGITYFLVPQYLEFFLYTSNSRILMDLPMFWALLLGLKYMRSKAETAYHPSCTLKMGIDKMSVVDEKLKVHGLQNLRVADASVMPEITSGNLNAPTLMIAERASDFILNK